MRNSDHWGEGGYTNRISQTCYALQSSVNKRSYAPNKRFLFVLARDMLCLRFSIVDVEIKIRDREI